MARCSATLVRSSRFASRVSFGGLTLAARAASASLREGVARPLPETTSGSTVASTVAERRLNTGRAYVVGEPRPVARLGSAGALARPARPRQVGRHLDGRTGSRGDDGGLVGGLAGHR